MNGHLLERSLGHTGLVSFQRTETARRIEAIASAPDIRFNGDLRAEQRDKINSGQDVQVWAHRAGVQCSAIDRFEGRYLLSGGSDATIHLWDLEDIGYLNNSVLHKPLASVHKSEHSHQYGITSLSFYPFDSGLFLSSSYDHHVNVYDTNSLEISASFDLGSVVYSHHISPIASHLLVAISSQHPAIRLADLRTGSSVHSLVGHAGAVLSVAWSPRDEHVLASGGVDGTIRMWDVRRSAGCLGNLDLEDSTGILGSENTGMGARARQTGKAHTGACNGVVWTEDGDFIVSTGHDERIRVWDMAIGANALAHFGPQIRNTKLMTVLPLVVPKSLTRPGQGTMFYPNEKEILMFNLFEGTLLKRLRPPRVSVAQPRSKLGQRNVTNRVTSLAWRRGHVEMFSTHSDGMLRAWAPFVEEEVIDTVEEPDRVSDEEKKWKKRKALDDIYRNLTKKPITFR